MPDLTNKTQIIIVFCIVVTGAATLFILEFGRKITEFEAHQMIGAVSTILAGGIAASLVYSVLIQKKD